MPGGAAYEPLPPELQPLGPGASPGLALAQLAAQAQAAGLPEEVGTGVGS